MQVKQPIIKLAGISLLIILSACGTTTYESVYPTLSDGKYDSEFPYRNCSEQLEEISLSLTKLDVLVFYRTYSFAREDAISLVQIRSNKDKMEKLGGTKDIFSESVGGTALSILSDNNRMAFLTCSHVVDFPDTVISYFPYPDNNIIQVIGIKARQQNNISLLPDGSDLEILAIDSKEDIAILGKETNGEQNDYIDAITYPMGDSEELEWGSFVYIMGFPLGHAMITRGIVSDPKRIKKGSFLIDAVFNHGFSGGPVIAVRDGVPNFEIVGMVKSSAAVNRYYFTPRETDNLTELNFNESYKGELKLVSEKDIKYGITFSVTSGTLREFYKKNRQQLEDKGYYLDEFFD